MNRNTPSRKTKAGYMPATITDNTTRRENEEPIYSRAAGNKPEMTTRADRLKATLWVGSIPTGRTTATSRNQPANTPATAPSTIEDRPTPPTPA